jgi:hypothetical protein
MAYWRVAQTTNGNDQRVNQEREAALRVPPAYVELGQMIWKMPPAEDAEVDCSSASRALSRSGSDLRGIRRSR